MNVFIIAAQTKDGFIGKDASHNSMEWTSGADKSFFITKTKEAGVVVMGRKTFETIGKALPERKTIVMTRDTTTVPNIPGVLFTSDTPEEIIARLVLEGYEQVAILGGASIYKLFLDAGLVDTAYITEENITFGTGIPLFDVTSKQKLEEVSSTPLGPDTILFEYKINN